jgi:serine protease AprX
MRYAITGATVEQVRSVGGADIKETRSTGIIFANLTPEQANKLRAMGCQVTLVGKVSAAVSPPVAPPMPIAAAPTYTPEQLVSAAGIDAVRALTEPPLYGEGFNLAIIDTGIRETHEKINGRVVYRKNYTSDPMRDDFNHGTGTCSIALAAAPLCNILNMKVLDSKGEGTEEEAILAVDDCISLWDTQPDIAPRAINLSLGTPDDGNPNNPLRVACRAAIDKGIWVVAAAGNSGPALGTIMSPACERYVMAIGSTSYEPFLVSNFSSRGPTKEGLIKPDVVLFGEGIIMASSSSDSATISKSGTSFATPLGSGAAILYNEGYIRRAVPTQPLPGVYPELGIWIGVQDLEKYLGACCVKPQGAPAEKDNDYGYGLPFGPLIAQIFQVTPAVDISALLLPVVAIGMMGIVMSAMTKALD